MIHNNVYLNEANCDMGNPIDLDALEVQRVLDGKMLSLFMPFKDGYNPNFLADNPSGFTQVVGNMWVREQWNLHNVGGVLYKANCGELIEPSHDDEKTYRKLEWWDFCRVEPLFDSISVGKRFKFKSPRNMPKKYCRIILHCVWVKVVKFRCMTEDDVRGFGVDNGFVKGVVKNEYMAYRLMFLEECKRRFRVDLCESDPFVMIVRFAPSMFEHTRRYS